MNPCAVYSRNILAMPLTEKIFARCFLQMACKPFVLRFKFNQQPFDATIFSDHPEDSAKWTSDDERQLRDDHSLDCSMDVHTFWPHDLVSCCQKFRHAVVCFDSRHVGSTARLSQQVINAFKLTNLNRDRKKTKLYRVRSVVKKYIYIQSYLLGQFNCELYVKAPVKHAD